MAIDVKFSICQSSNCKGITFKETTGLYDAVSNTTGWGAVGGGDPNDMISDATDATLTLTGPDGTVYPALDLFALDGFPKSTEDGYLFQASAVDSSLTDFADGNWEMTYSVTTSSGTYDETITLFFHCKISACVCRLVSEIEIDDCKCDTDKLNKALQAKAFSDALSYAVGCGNLNAANEILTSLQKLCSCS